MALSSGKTLKRCGWSCLVVYNSQRESIHYFTSDALGLPSELLQGDSSNTLQDRFPERCSSLQANGSQVFAESTLQKSRQQQALCKGKVCKRKERWICAPNRTERSRFWLNIDSVPTVSKTTSLPPYAHDRKEQNTT